MKKNLTSILLLALAFYACEATQESKTATVENEKQELAENTASATPVEAIVNWEALVVRDTPKDKGKYVTSVYQGEALKLTGKTEKDPDSDRKNTYAEVELSDGTTGWVLELFISPEATAGAFVNETVVYKRPDLLTKTDTRFGKMDFVAITEVKDDWIQIKGVPSGATWYTEGWVRKENVTTYEMDVSLAVLYNRANKEKDEKKKEDDLNQLVNNTDFQSSLFYEEIVEKTKTPEPDLKEAVKEAAVNPDDSVATDEI